ncbi:MAG: acyltransferase family protein [Actinomycetales bacterium]
MEASAVQAQEPVSTKPAPLREIWIDQARWAAIALVLIGHLVGPLRGRSTLAHAISDFVYIFHIPALVLLAGWGARRASANGRGLVRTFWALIVPYVIFQTIAFGLGYLLHGAHPSWQYVYTTFGLWFLVSLATWRLLAPWFHGLRGAVLIALAISLVAGVSPGLGSLLSLQRTACFLPLFVAGPWVVDRVSAVRRWPRAGRIQVAALGVLLLGAAMVLARQPHFDRTIYFGRTSYEELHQGLVHGVLARILALAVATVLAVALMLAMPGGALGASLPARWAAVGGQHTMFPYLLHLPVLLIAAWTGWYDYGSGTVAALVAACVGLALAIVFVTPPVLWLAGPFVEPRAWWDRVRALRHRPAQASSA